MMVWGLTSRKFELAGEIADSSELRFMVIWNVQIELLS